MQRVSNTSRQRGRPVNPVTVLVCLRNNLSVGPEKTAVSGNTGEESRGAAQSHGVPHSLELQSTIQTTRLPPPLRVFSRFTSDIPCSTRLNSSAARRGLREGLFSSNSHHRNTLDEMYASCEQQYKKDAKCEDEGSRCQVRASCLFLKLQKQCLNFSASLPSRE